MAVSNRPDDPSHESLYPPTAPSVYDPQATQIYDQEPEPQAAARPYYGATQQEYVVWPSIYNETPSPDARKPEHRSLLNRAVIGAGATAALLGITAGFVSVANREETSNTPPPAEADPSPEENQNSEIFTNEGGNIHPAVIEEGEATITVQRRGGQVVEIPASLGELDPSNPSVFVNSVLGLYAGYINDNDGNIQIAQALTPNTELRDVMTEKRDYMACAYHGEANGSCESPQNFGLVQWVLRDNPNNPAQFVVEDVSLDTGEQGRVVRMTGGDLYELFTDDDRWQGPNTSAAYSDTLETKRLTYFDIFITGPNSNPVVEGIQYDFEDVPYEDTVVQ